jgi:hypothetical protein
MKKNLKWLPGDFFLKKLSICSLGTFGEMPKEYVIGQSPK